MIRAHRKLQRSKFGREASSYTVFPRAPQALIALSLTMIKRKKDIALTNNCFKIRILGVRIQRYGNMLVHAMFIYNYNWYKQQQKLKKKRWRSHPCSIIDITTDSFHNFSNSIAWPCLKLINTTMNIVTRKTSHNTQTCLTFAANSLQACHLLYFPYRRFPGCNKR